MCVGSILSLAHSLPVSLSHLLTKAQATYVCVWIFFYLNNMHYFTGWITITICGSQLRKRHSYGRAPFCYEIPSLYFIFYELHKCSARSLHVVFTLQLHATHEFPHTSTRTHTQTRTHTNGYRNGTRHNNNNSNKNDDKEVALSSRSLSRSHSHPKCVLLLFARRAKLNLFFFRTIKMRIFYCC